MGIRLLFNIRLGDRQRWGDGCIQGFLCFLSICEKFKLYHHSDGSNEGWVDAFKDFRPISLVGSLYKLIAKVLANKLKNVMT